MILIKKYGKCFQCGIDKSRADMACWGEWFPLWTCRKCLIKYTYKCALVYGADNQIITSLFGVLNRINK